MPNHPPNPDVRLLDGQWYASRPWQQLRWLRDHAPVYWDETSGLWGITRHDDIMAIARDPETFCSSGSSRPDGPPVPSMINMDGAAHKIRRKLVNKGFTKRRLAAQESRIRSICAELIEKVAPRGECDLVHELAAPLPMIMIGDMLGVAPEDRLQGPVLGHAQVTHRADARTGKALQGFTADARYDRDGQWVETPFVVARIDDRQAIGFVEVRSDLRDELVLRDADRSGERGFLKDASLDVRSDLSGRSKQGHARGDIEKRLVQRQAFNERRVAAEDLEDLFRHGLVVRHARTDT